MRSTYAIYMIEMKSEYCGLNKKSGYQDYIWIYVWYDWNEVSM